MSTPAAPVRAVPALLLCSAPFLVGIAVFLWLGPSDALASARSGPSIRGVFLGDCAVCHGSDGRGTGAGPSLQGVGAAAVDYWVSTGRMPLALGQHTPPVDHQRPKYPADEIAALVAYVARLTGGGLDIPHVSPADGDVAAGGALYRLNCAACHAWAGTGGALEHREAPPLHDATATQIAEAVRIGPDPMPKFSSAALTDRQLDGVVAYVLALDHPDDRGGSPLWHGGPLTEGAVAIVLGLGVLLLATRLIGTRT